MATLDAVKPARFAAVSVLGQVRCDHPECPASAAGSCVVYGQDFYFCQHHANELLPVVASLPEQPLPQRGADTAVWSMSPCRVTKQGAT